jgi:LAS superfamily LD-carboxypeptidase LdcB
MHYSRGARVVLAFLVFVIFAAYLYLHISSIHLLGTPPKETATETNAAPSGQEGEAQGQTASVEGEAGQTSSAEQTTSAQPAPTVDPASPYGKALANAAAKGLPTPPAVDITSWEFTLVNGDHSIADYAPEQLAYLQQTMTDSEKRTAPANDRCPVDMRIADALLAMGQGCKDAGLPIYFSSGYRSYSDQAANFKRVCENNGITDGKINGYYITMPAGCSEHQLALCCDITDKYYALKNDDIVASDTIQWLLAHCAEYGFVQRFPDGKQEVTGVMNESWHFRYVGIEVARYMTDNHLVLEEFLALYGVE